MELQEVIMEHVLRFVPGKSLCRFKSVSKSWNQWISSPFLAHQQAIYFSKTSGFFSHSHQEEHPIFIPVDHHSHGVPSPSLSFLPESAAVRSTSNGLLCCQSTSEETTYFICNPITEEWRKLPDPTLFHGSASAIALSFSPSTYSFDSHFQIVCAVPFYSVNAVYFEIYSSRTNSWRLAESPYVYSGAGDGDGDGDGGLTFFGDGFCLSGCVYWEASNGVVLGFDLTYEEPGEIRLPDLPPGCGALMEMQGELCYVVAMARSEKDDDMEGYSLGVYDGYDMSLKRRVPLDLGDFDGEVVRVLSCVSDGVVVILVGSNVVLYDVKERKGRFVREIDDPASSGVDRFLPYVNSLVGVCPVEKMPKEDCYFEEVLKNMS